MGVSPPTPGHHIIRITNQPVFPLRKPTTFPPSQEKSVVLMAGPPGRNDCTTAALTAAASNLPTRKTRPTNLSKKPPVISNQRRCLVGIQEEKREEVKEMFSVSLSQVGISWRHRRLSVFSLENHQTPFFRPWSSSQTQEKITHLFFNGISWVLEESCYPI